MRRSHIFILVTAVVLFIIALNSVFALLSLLIEDAALDIINPSELSALTSTVNLSLSQLIPKIMHQTYINASIPERWRLAQKSCIELHPDYEYKLWSDSDSLAFISREYPWFLETFVKYPHNIQRADAIRYFVLVSYGGIYIDLDIGCKRRLDPLLQFPAWVHLTDPTGISNDGMGAAPRHPFFIHVINSLQRYNRSWILPYITIMSTTGPLFLSLVWKQYMQMHLKEQDPSNWRVRVLAPDEYFRLGNSFFNLYGGSSWHGDDAKFFLWMGQHLLMTTMAGFSVGTIVGLCIWRAYRQALQLRRPRDLSTTERASPRLQPHRGSRLSLWRAWSWWNGKDSYELVENQVT